MNEEISLPKLRQDMMANYIELYLNSHSLASLYSLIEFACEQKAHRETEQFEHEFRLMCDKLLKLEKQPVNPTGGKIIAATDKGIANMELSCSVINRLIAKTNLTHQERMILLLTYLRLGDKGEARFRQILSQQANYDSRITDTQIASAKKRPKYGISCKRLQKLLICSDIKCKYYSQQ